MVGRFLFSDGVIAGSARTACLTLALLAAPARAESSIVHFEATMADGGRVELAARLVKPSGDAPFAAIVLLHGCDGTDLYPIGWSGASATGPMSSSTSTAWDRAASRMPARATAK